MSAYGADVERHATAMAPSGDMPGMGSLGSALPNAGPEAPRELRAKREGGLIEVVTLILRWIEEDAPPATVPPTYNGGTGE